MKTRWKTGLVAVMAGAIALVLVLGASIGTAAAPDAALSDDYVFLGNGGTGANNVKLIDVDAMAVIRTLASGTSLANNHGVLIDGTNRYLFNTNAALASGLSRMTKFDLGTMSEVAVWDAYADDAGVLTSGLCGIEYEYNNTSNNIWVSSMSAGTANGGLYEVNPSTGFTGGYVDTSAGADNGQNCGIGWTTSGSLAYASLMTTRKTNELNWTGGGGSLSGESSGINAPSTALHMLDVAKASEYAYVTAGNAASIGYIEIIDISGGSMSLVTKFQVAGTPTGYADAHDVKVAHDEGFLYVHTRLGQAADPKGTLLIYDLVDDVGNANDDGASATSPVLIGTIADQGTSTVSCGTQLVAEADICPPGGPDLTLSKVSTYWNGYPNYLAGLLNVDYAVNNDGTTYAYNVNITGSTTNTAATLNSGAPAALGNIAAGGSAGFTLVYNVPTGVGSFMATVTGTAEDLCGNTQSY